MPRHPYPPKFPLPRHIRDADEGYQLLAGAIIATAVYDYRRYPKQRLQIRRFFESDWFLILASLNGVEPLVVLEAMKIKHPRANEL